MDCKPKLENFGAFHNTKIKHLKNEETNNSPNLTI